MAGDPFCDQWSLRPRGSSVTFVTKCELPALWPPAPPSEIARAGPIYGGIARLSWDTFRDRIRPARSGSLSAPARIRTWDLRIRSPLLYPAELRGPRGRGSAFPHRPAGGAAGPTPPAPSARRGRAPPVPPGGGAPRQPAPAPPNPPPRTFGRR